MKKFIALSLFLLMLNPLPAFAKSQYVYVVTQIGEDKISYNKDGLVTKYADYKMKYQKGKLVALTDQYRTNHLTYQKGKLSSVNQQKVSYAKKRITYTVENKGNMEMKTSPKGTCISFQQKSPFSDSAQFLLNKKGQLLVSHYMFTDSFYNYDEKGFVVNGSQLDLTTGVGAYKFKMKNTYRKSLLTSRTIDVSYDSNYTQHEKFTYKKIKVNQKKAILKQQKVLLNKQDIIVLAF